MPYTVSNTFSPITPFGEALQNVTRLMFSGSTAADRDKAALNAAHADLYRTQAEAARAKLEEEARARRDMAEAPRRLVGQMFGNQQAADTWMASRQTGATPLAGFDMPDAEAGPMPQAPQPMPLQVDPQAASRAARLLTGIEAAKALPGNDTLGGLAKIVPMLYGIETSDDVRAGRLDPTTAAGAGYAAGLHGNEPFKQGQFGMGNVITGGLADPRLFNAETDLRVAKKATEKAEQNRRNAAAGASSAQAGKTRLETDRLREDVWEPVLDPVTLLPKLDASGQPVLIRRSARGAAMQRTEGQIAVQDNKDANREPKAGAPGKPRPLTRNDTDLLRGELDALLNALPDADSVDGATKKALLSEAERQWQAGAAGHASAAKAAIDRLAPDGFEKSGVPGFRSSGIKGGQRPGTDARPAASGGAPGGLPAPKSQAEYDALPPGAQYMGTDGQVKIKRAKRNADGSVGS